MHLYTCVSGLQTIATVAMLYESIRAELWTQVGWTTAHFGLNSEKVLEKGPS